MKICHSIQIFSLCLVSLKIDLTGKSAEKEAENNLLYTPIVECFLGGRLIAMQRKYFLQNGGLPADALSMQRASESINT